MTIDICGTGFSVDAAMDGVMLNSFQHLHYLACKRAPYSETISRKNLDRWVAVASFSTRGKQGDKGWVRSTLSLME